MRRLFILLFVFVGSLSVYAFEAGTGISFFIPESLYSMGEGSVSMEQSLGFSLSISKNSKIPLGIIYNTNYGLTTENSTTKSPWFYSDSLLTYIGLNYHIPIQVIYFDLFAAGAMNWNITLRPLESNIEKDLSTSSEQVVIIDDSLEYQNSLGYGFMAGGSVGITLGQISVGIDVLYRSIQHELGLKGQRASLLNTTASPFSFENDKLIMRGITIGLSGSFKM